MDKGPSSRPAVLADGRADPSTDPPAPGAPAAFQAGLAWRRTPDGLLPVADSLAEEWPVALVYNGLSQAVMMATPQDLEDFALGFSLTEGILTRPDQLYDCRRRDHDTGTELEITIAAARFATLKQRRRTLVGRTGCGLCGIDSLAEAMPDLAPLAGPFQPIAAGAIAAALGALPARQLLNETTHAVHAAAWADPLGQLVLVREDVGRHNAVDKLIGARCHAGLATGPAGQAVAPGFLLVTSRCSYEIVQKAVIAGIGLVAAVSAPTAQAVRLAEAAGLTLVAFARGERFSVYSHPGHLIA